MGRAAIDAVQVPSIDRTAPLTNHSYSSALVSYDSRDRIVQRRLASRVLTSWAAARRSGRGARLMMRLSARPPRRRGWGARLMKRLCNNAIAITRPEQVVTSLVT